jgi:hypothetical protein
LRAALIPSETKSAMPRCYHAVLPRIPGAVSVAGDAVDVGLTPAS